MSKSRRRRQAEKHARKLARRKAIGARSQPHASIGVLQSGFSTLSAPAKNFALMLLSLVKATGLREFTGTAGGPNLDTNVQELEQAGLFKFQRVFKGTEANDEKSFAVRLLP